MPQYDKNGTELRVGNIVELPNAVQSRYGQYGTVIALGSPPDTTVTVRLLKDSKRIRVGANNLTVNYND